MPGTLLAFKRQTAGSRIRAKPKCKEGSWYILKDFKYLPEITKHTSGRLFE